MLNLAQEGSLRVASRTGIELAFQALFTHIQAGTWLDRNRYLSNTIQVIDQDLASNTVDLAALAEYIAASAPTHCADGWSYLGRAIASLSSGEPDVTRHLAYYAELRAAMSLLASNGVGVFNNRHFVVDNTGAAQHFPGSLPTHRFVWLAMRFWAGLPHAASLVQNIISPQSMPLQAWLAEFLAGTAFVAIATDWLRTWGLDLAALADDRDARNVASYRPSRLEHHPALGALDCARFVQQLWEIHGPRQQSRFEILDRHLLRRSLNQAMRALGISIQDFANRIVRMIDRMNFTTEQAIKDEWTNFFVGATIPQDPALLTEAELRTAVSATRHHIQVISRAALLLRIATGSCAKLIRDMPYTAEDLEFWWKPLGHEVGLWTDNEEPGTNPGDITELWHEVQTALDDISSWTASVHQASMADLRLAQSGSLSVLQGCERIALWGLIP